MEGTEGGQVIRIFLRGTSRVKRSRLRQRVAHPTWKKLGKDCGGEGSRSRGARLEVKSSSL